MKGFEEFVFNSNPRFLYSIRRSNQHFSSLHLNLCDRPTTNRLAQSSLAITLTTGLVCAHNFLQLLLHHYRPPKFLLSFLSISYLFEPDFLGTSGRTVWNWMMAKQAQTLFLEEWLRSNSGSSTNISSRHSSSSSAQAIIQAWADLRDSLQHQYFNPHHLQSLKTLSNSQTSLYVSDPQAKLILSILSSPKLSLPHESYPLFLKLLYIWVRKSSRPSSVVIDSAVEVLSQLFSGQLDITKNSFFSEGVLLLGAFSFVPSASKKSKSVSLELLCRLLEENYQSIGYSETHIVNFLAGIGYALSSSESVHFIRILDSLFGIWDKEDGPCGTVSHGLMILHLVEWVVSSFINSHSFKRIDVFTREVLETSKPYYAPFAIVMAAAGALRSSKKSVSIEMRRLRNFAEKRIETVSRDLISKTGGFINSCNNPGNSLLLQCISLALARSGPVAPKAPLVICLASALLTEVFPLLPFYTRILEYPRGNLAKLGLDEVKAHLNHITFKEAGIITGVFCNQYVSSDEESKSRVENLIWVYCQDVYLGHRQVRLMLQGGHDELLRDLEKIAESAFLMVVVFALAVSKHRLDSKFTQQTQMEISVKILVSFSCMEYFRRVRLPEYMDTIRGVVVSIQENESACISFVESMPSYVDLTNPQGSSNLQITEYTWSKDEVQIARILFYLRVIPTCIERLPTPIFRRVVAPTMFLYMGHPNGKVARASHSMFVAFVSSGNDSDEDERVVLKEQLVFYYMKRSLEGYPGITPFDGMASGVAALVRHLPAASPSIFYCIQCLVEKANNLCSEAMIQDADLWKNWQGELDPCKKILDLLLRLLSLVDIQVAESDDVTRKPTLVSWLQSLSYLCSQVTSTSATSLRVGPEVNAAPAWSTDTLSLNRISARL
ncbi:uncharacterized protein LOC132296892 isoform X2 [Cornus florida]|uniref:uncharacterized protein LOC132296892 isoform X2 n=1 Tax=Cornus florida TaxID=4283 RepID=UPI00289B4B7F|nr:uncharacterized protein LOC132296892 isoform X2 [Cornus florida]